MVLTQAPNLRQLLDWMPKWAGVYAVDAASRFIELLTNDAEGLVEGIHDLCERIVRSRC
jgi:hypothetical protein